MAHYVHDENHNRIEAYSAEEVLSVLEQAIEDQSLAGITANSGFITKVKSATDNKTYSVAFCTQAVYNSMEAAGTLQPDTMYYITDDATIEDFESVLEYLTATVSEHTEKIAEHTVEINANTAAAAANTQKLNNVGVNIQVVGADSAQDPSDNYAAITKNGLYACFVMDNVNYDMRSEMISVFDINSAFLGEYLLYDYTNKKIEISQDKFNANWRLFDCRLVVSYEV
jgi:hypothetical protein